MSISTPNGREPGLDLNVQFSKTKKLSVYVIFTNRTRQSAEFALLKNDSCEYKLGKEKKHGTYARFAIDEDKTNKQARGSKEDIIDMAPK